MTKNRANRIFESAKYWIETSIPIYYRRLRDSKYFTFYSLIKGNDDFYTDNVKYKVKRNEDMILVSCFKFLYWTCEWWRVNPNLYTEACLPKMLQFINTTYSRDTIIFWPGLASYYCARTTRTWLEAWNIPSVPRADNPPNIPQARTN